ncbi:PIN domain-containing protein [Pararobbsia alpina]|uniref:PIN domain-containing protein n=1 Tax=Pararobbsia alpina TaxID=621374 RepID=UPI0039A64644
MSSNFTVVYDACVLYPAPLRDLLMHLALTDLYRARWSDMIHDEWTRSLLAKRTDLKPEAVQRTRELMDAHIRDGKVSNFEHLIGVIDLPDPDDRHVVAAAMHAGAELIVTMNVRDFPKERIAKHNVCVQHPDDFIVDLMDLNRQRVLEAIARHRKSMRRPPKTAAEYLDTMSNQGLLQMVDALRPYAAWAI